MPTPNDEQLYLDATQEVDSGTQDHALWAKAMALDKGDEEKARYRYIELRVEELTEAPTSHHQTTQFWLSRAAPMGRDQSPRTPHLEYRMPPQGIQIPCRKTGRRAMLTNPEVSNMTTLPAPQNADASAKAPASDPRKSGLAIASLVCGIILMPTTLFAQDANPGGKDADSQIGGYIVIPLNGEIGVYITDRVIGQCLKQATKIGPDVVILDIDSGGGSVEEKEKILSRLIKWKNDNPTIRLVAHVTNALSAAAMIAMPCEQIFMRHGSTIGAAMVITPTGSGYVALEDTKVGEKFASSMRATDRAAALAGGHDPLLIEAMIDVDMELWMEIPGDGSPPVIVRSDPRQAQRRNNNNPIRMIPGQAQASVGKRRKIITKRGKLLTLAAEEAVECGLAEAVVEDHKEIMVAFGFTDSVESDDLAGNIARQHARKITKAKAEVARLTKLIDNKLSSAEDDAYWSGDDASLSLSTIRDCRAIIRALTRMERINKISAGLIDDIDAVQELKKKIDFHLKESSKSNPTKKRRTMPIGRIQK